MTEIRVKRIYEAASDDDGLRILVDRIWPRGISKESARLDAWWKELSPSTELRKAFDHDPARWDDFRERFHRQLEESDLTAALAAIKNKRVTFLFGAKEERYNNAVALREYFLDRLSI